MRLVALLSAIYSALLFAGCFVVNKRTCDSRDEIVFRESHNPFLQNQIFTKAIGIYVEFPSDFNKSSRGKVESEIKQAYIAALSIWGSSLMLASSQVDSNVNLYLRNHSFSNFGSSVYNPPVVEIVSCIDHASTVIKIVTNSSRLFPPKGNVVALSQMPGRTIMLNCSGFKFYYRSGSFEIKSNDSLNLAIVLTHEIGHSLGLKHETNTSRRSIMSPFFNDLWFGIATSDGLNFSRILMQKINGPKAGYFQPERCSGLITL